MDRADNEGPQYVTTGEASHMLRVSANYVRNLVNAGELDAEITPLGRLISHADVMRLKLEREAKASRQPPARQGRIGMVTA